LMLAFGTFFDPPDPSESRLTHDSIYIPRATFHKISQVYYP
jgi:hypothetical protein